VRLWIDTDVGENPDDAVALLCAAAHPDVDLVGVSCGDGDFETRAAVAGELVDAPVVEGAALTAREIAAAELDALLAIGPLDTVARLLAAGVLPARVGVMGGTLRSVRHRGAVREVEHNFATEPAAAQAVVEHAHGVVLCPLDVTVRMRPSDEDIDRLARAAPELGRMFDDWVERQRAAGLPEDEAVVRLHDPLALLALVGEPVVTVERRSLRIDAQGRVHEETGRGHPVDLVTDVNAGRALGRIVALVAQRAGRGQ